MLKCYDPNKDKCRKCQLINTAINTDAKIINNCGNIRAEKKTTQIGRVSNFWKGGENMKKLK